MTTNEILRAQFRLSLSTLTALSRRLSDRPSQPAASAGRWFIASNRITTAGNFLFASNSESNDVSAFAIDPIAGALSPVPGSPFPTGGTGAWGIALSATPDGRLLMAANNDGASPNVTVFNIAADGSLTPIAGSPFPTQSRPDGIKVTPNGKFLAVAEPEAGGVEMFSIASGGALTSLGKFAEGGTGSLAGVDVDCSTSFLYGGEASISTTVDAYNIAPDGTLTALAGSPFMPGVGASSYVVTLSPDDKTLFVSNQESSTITVFSVDSGGSLSLLAGSPFPMHHHVSLPTGMATSQDGTLLYVAGSKGSVSALSVFSVATDGTLAEVAGSPFFPGQPPSLLSLTAYPPKSCVPPHATVTTVVASQNPAPVGQTIYFTATVTNDVAGPVTGTVTFWNHSKKMGNMALSNGVAVFPFVFDKNGHKLITAVYSGDLYNSPSTSPALPLDAAHFPIRTQMKLTSSLNPSHAGRARDLHRHHFYKVWQDPRRRTDDLRGPFRSNHLGKSPSGCRQGQPHYFFPDCTKKAHHPRDLPKRFDIRHRNQASPTACDRVKQCWTPLIALPCPRDE